MTSALLEVEPPLTSIASPLPTFWISYVPARFIVGGGNCDQTAAALIISMALYGCFSFVGVPHWFQVRLALLRLFQAAWALDRSQFALGELHHPLVRVRNSLSPLVNQ